MSEARLMADWTLVSDMKMPGGETVLVYLSEPSIGSRFAIYQSKKIQNGYIGVINGVFDFDLGREILAWRRLDDLVPVLPEGGTDA